MSHKHNTDLGQHFMIDKELLGEIISLADIQDQEQVLEVGGGDGALTKLLKEKSIKLTTVEIDTRYEADIHANILDIIDTLEFDSLISNLPYHICEPLFIKLSLKRPKKIVVVVGERFAQHLLDESILGTVFQDIYEIQLVRSIDASSFEPPPKVVSALLLCHLKNELGPLADFYAYPKSKVKNYFKTKMSKKGAQEFINQLSLPLQEKRLYELSREEFLQVANVIRLMNL